MFRVWFLSDVDDLGMKKGEILFLVAFLSCLVLECSEGSSF